MLLMLLVAVMGMSLQSCSKEETKIFNPVKCRLWKSLNFRPFIMVQIV